MAHPPAPFWPVILGEHGATIGVHVCLALVAAAVYIAARSSGLADLGHASTSPSGPRGAAEGPRRSCRAGVYDKRGVPAALRWDAVPGKGEAPGTPRSGSIAPNPNRVEARSVSFGCKWSD